MARKITGLQRVLDAPALFSVAYGEIASSIYVALGIIALHALGLTPEVLAIVGALFVIVSLSYAEGTTSIPETGGAATFVRRAFNDLVGFLTGWAIFLDYLIVIALSGLFLPHYLGAAMQWGSLEHNPWDVVVGVCVVFGVAAIRLVRRSAFYSYGIFVAVLDLMTQLLLVVLGFAFLFSSDALTHGVSIGTHPSWHQIAFALPLAMLAYTGLETVANLAEETREPGRDLPRSLFSGIGLVVLIYVAIACVALSAFPATNGTTALGTEWLGSPLMGIVDALRGHLPSFLATALRVYVGLTGAVILLVAVTTSISGFTRLAHSLGEHGQLPRAFGRLNRRTLVSPQAIVAAALIANALMIGTSFVHDDIAFLASLFSFGVLAAFTAAQLAVIRLRFTEPELPRPYRAPWNVRVRGVEVPLPAIVGSAATFAIWIAAIATHPGARYGGPAWLAAGGIVYLLVRRGRGEGLLEHVQKPPQVFPESEFTSILVPMKLGAIGEEMIATAVKLARDRDAHVEALFVIRVPLDQPLDADLNEQEESAAASLAEARLLGADSNVDVQVETVRARSIGDAIVGEASRRGSDLIVVGSAPRWRRQSRFFSPTVEYVLRKAPCEVLVVAFPEGVMEEDGVDETVS
ncbi:MAG TPA: universal stress protein [Gaiellaceae bacterium]|nr:universal stress protein [Gaiellaceae bacterium]